MLGTILTAAGIQRFLTATPEEQITITELAVGDGGGPGNTVDPTMTELRNETWRGEASAPIRDPENPNVLTFEVMIPADVGGFTIREVGLYDELGQLVAVGVTSETEKPTLSQAIGFTLTIRVHIALANASDVELVVQEVGSIDHQGLNNRDALDCHPAKAIGVDNVSDHPEIQTAQDMLNSLWATQQSHSSSISQLQSDVQGALGTVTLEGDSLVYPGSTNTYTITNYDSFSQYEVIASRETVSRSNDTITFTVGAGAADGEVEINVKRDGRDNVFTLAIGEAGVRTPTITQPVADAVVGSLVPTIKTDAFVAYPAGIDSHISTDWEVATDAGFSNVVWSSLADTVNKVEIALPTGVLSPETDYYVRARHNGSTYQSGFSSVVKFTTPAHYIVTPSITEPTDGAIGIGESPILKCTAFESMPEDYDTHKSTSWRVRRKSDGVVVWELLQSTSSLASITVPAGILAEATEYEALVRHEGYTLGVGSWSDPVSFTTDDQFVPSEPGAPFGGGFFAGLYTDNGETFALVVAPKSAEIEAQWKTSQTSTSGTDSVIDGLANSNAMNNTTHPAAKHCRDYRGGGFDDWSLPAQNQLEIAYYELKPGDGSNDTSSGINPNAVPPRDSNYTANNPSQTSIAAFKKGGAQAFEEASYWTSTQTSAVYARLQSFNNGIQGNNFKDDTRRVRPCRSVKIS